MTTQPTTPATKPNKPALGFIISLAAGILNLLLGVFFTLWSMTYHPTGYWNILSPEGFVPTWFKGTNPTIIGAIEAISGIIIIIGAVLIYMPRKATAGVPLVIIFSLIAFINLPSWVIIVGIIGGGLGLAKK